jgi:phenylpyruvate tautomerase PptA (4-oxalocrotonate tautomerase family)
MPLIEVKLYDRRVQDAESEKRIIEEMTEALVRATGDEGVREHTWVVVQGVAPTAWGIAGKPGS